MPLWITWALGNGWHVILPDHEAINSAFMAGHDAGPAVLDAVRVTLEAAQLDKNTPVGLHGYSGGAHATAWATQYASSYAPDLNIVGASHAGTPVDLAIQSKVDGTPFSGFLPTAVAGLLSVYPPELKANVSAQCAPPFNEAIKYAGQYCGIQVFQKYAQTDISSLCSNQTGFNLWTSPEISQLMARESLLANVSSLTVNVPTFPRLIQHGEKDLTVAEAGVAIYVEQQCSSPDKKAHIQWFSYPGLDHAPASVASIPASMQFFLRVFNESLPSVECGAAPADMLTLSSPQLSATLGNEVAEALLSMNGSNNTPGQA